MYNTIVMSVFRVDTQKNLWRHMEPKNIWGKESRHQGDIVTSYTSCTYGVFHKLWSCSPYHFYRLKDVDHLFNFYSFKKVWNGNVRSCTSCPVTEMQSTGITPLCSNQFLYRDHYVMLFKNYRPHRTQNFKKSLAP